MTFTLECHPEFCSACPEPAQGLLEDDDVIPSTQFDILRQLSVLNPRQSS